MTRSGKKTLIFFQKTSFKECFRKQRMQLWNVCQCFASHILKMLGKEKFFFQLFFPQNISMDSKNAAFITAPKTFRLIFGNVLRKDRKWFKELEISPKKEFSKKMFYEKNAPLDTYKTASTTLPRNVRQRLFKVEENLISRKHDSTEYFFWTYSFQFWQTCRISKIFVDIPEVFCLSSELI